MVALLGLWFALGGQAVYAQFAENPFFEHTEHLSFAYGTEMITIRLRALAAIDEPDEEFVEEVGEALEEDLPRFVGSLEAQDPELAQQLKAALEEVIEAAEEGIEFAGLAQHAQDLAGQAYRLLVPLEVQERSAFRAALMTKLLLAQSGVAEGYEEAAEGEIWEYPGGWAALQRVKELWEELKPMASEVQAFEVEDMLRMLGNLFPSPLPPDDIERGNPEEAEAPAHRIVGFLEEITDAALYPDRNRGELFVLTRNLVEAGCSAYGENQAHIGRERIVAANFYYADHLGGMVELLAPEVHAEVTQRMSVLVEGSLETQQLRDQCQEIPEQLEQAQHLLGV
jgi:hypothetical protein